MSNPELSFVHDNMLLVDGKHLQTRLRVADRRKERVSPEELQTVLTLGHQAIRLQIDVMFDKMQRLNPDSTVHRGSIWTVQMIGPRHIPGLAYTEEGLDNGTGITSDMLELQPPYHPYWSAIKHAGFIPEARQSMSRDTLDGGAWLLARIDPTPR